MRSRSLAGGTLAPAQPGWHIQKRASRAPRGLRVPAIAPRFLRSVHSMPLCLHKLFSAFRTHSTHLKRSTLSPTHCSRFLFIFYLQVQIYCLVAKLCPPLLQPRGR